MLILQDNVAAANCSSGALYIMQPMPRCSVERGAKWTIPRGMVERESAYVLGHFYDSVQGAQTRYWKLRNTNEVAHWCTSMSGSYTLEVGDKHWISNPIRAVQHRTLHHLVIDLQHISSTYMCAFLRDWLRDVITNFETCWGFPQTVGVIDVTHIPIACLQESASDYYTRKGYYSVIIQAVIGYGGLFIDAYIGWPGSIHDARVMVNSYLYQRAMNGTLLPDWKRLISGVQVCLFILGDPAYLACLG